METRPASGGKHHLHLAKSRKGEDGGREEVRERGSEGETVRGREGEIVRGRKGGRERWRVR